MASEPVPVPSLIASGQINKVARAAMPTMMGVAALPDALGHASRLFDNAERVSRLFGTGERVSRLLGAAYPRQHATTAFLDPARYVPKVLPTAAMESMLFSEATKRTFAAGSALDSFRPSPALRNFVGASEIIGQFKKPPWVDSLQLVQSYASMTATAARLAEAFVHEEVLPEIVGSDEATRAVGEAAEWVRELRPDERRALLIKVGHAIGTVVLVAKGMYDADSFMVAGALFAYAVALCSIYDFVRVEDKRRAGQSD